MLSMSVPILLALSAMSVMAWSATWAAFSVSPPSPWRRLAEKLVTVSMYALAERPAVLNALSALAKTVCWEESSRSYSPFASSTLLPTERAYSSSEPASVPKRVLTPPLSCSNWENPSRDCLPSSRAARPTASMASASLRAPAAMASERRLALSTSPKDSPAFSAFSRLFPARSAPSASSSMPAPLPSMARLFSSTAWVMPASCAFALFSCVTKSLTFFDCSL